MHTSEGKERYDQMMYQLLEQVWDEDTIKSRIAKVYQLIRPHVMKSTKGRRVEEFEDAINRLLRFVDARRYVVLRQLKVPFLYSNLMIGNPVLVWELSVFHEIKFFLTVVEFQ